MENGASLSKVDRVEQTEKMEKLLLESESTATDGRPRFVPKPFATAAPETLLVDS